eukprot:455063_1
MSANNNNNNTSIVTFRRNLRAIASVILHQLNVLKIYNKTGINIGVHWNGKRVLLENIKEIQPNKNQTICAYSVYGKIWEHIMEVVSSDSNCKLDEIRSMNFKKQCIDRDEIRALLDIKMNDDVNIFCAAEMDALMNDEKELVHVVELKCSKTYYNGHKWKFPFIPDGKLLKMWSQCFFGGVDKLIIAFQKNGIIKKIHVFKTDEIQKKFPIITNKCIELTYSVLKWLQDTVKQLPEHNMYHLSFDKKWTNSEFVLKHLSMPDKDKKIVFELLNRKDMSEKGVKSNYGLVINANTRQVELKTL